MVKMNYKIFFISLIGLIVVLMFLISNKGKIEVVEASDIEVKEEVYKVDIKGEINNPGVYEVSSSDRIIDVINKASGLTENADTTKTNLSKKVKDEMVIIIYSNIEDNNVKFESNELDSSTLDNSLISINTASLEELKTLPGIGESKANSIIKYRETSNFNTIEDIKNVSGIGESLFEKIKDYITV